MDVNDKGREVNHERIDNLRRGRGPIQEHVIDEFLAGFPTVNREQVVGFIEAVKLNLSQ